MDAGYVPYDPRVGEAVRSRQPFTLAYPKSAASKSLAALAMRISSGTAMAETKVGFFRKVASWF